MKLTRSALLKTKMLRALQPLQNRYIYIYIFFFFKLSQKQPASCFSLPHFLALVSDVTCQPRCLLRLFPLCAVEQSGDGRETYL